MIAQSDPEKLELLIIIFLVLFVFVLNNWLCNWLLKSICFLTNCYNW